MSENLDQALDYRDHARRRRRKDHAVNGSAEARSAKTVRGLRANSFAALVILLLEYGLGIWVNLYGQLPASDKGASLPAGFGRAVADGPIGLSVHAVLGLVLILSAVTAVVRSFQARWPVLIGAAIVGLAAVVIAALSGARFVGHGTNATSMSMAIAAGIAIGAYAFMLFLPVPASGRPIQAPANLSK